MYNVYTQTHRKAQAYIHTQQERHNNNTQAIQRIDNTYTITTYIQHIDNTYITITYNNTYIYNNIHIYTYIHNIHTYIYIHTYNRYIYITQIYTIYYTYNIIYRYMHIVYLYYIYSRYIDSIIQTIYYWEYNKAKYSGQLQKKIYWPQARRRVWRALFGLIQAAAKNASHRARVKK